MLNRTIIILFLLALPLICACQNKNDGDVIYSVEDTDNDAAFSEKQSPPAKNSKNRSANKSGVKNARFSDLAFRPDLYGPVKNLKMTVYAASELDNMPDKGYESYILTEKYDSLGMRQTESLFTTKNLLVAKSAILHNRDGFQTEVLYTDMFDNLLNRITYEAYKNGNWRRAVNYDKYYNPYSIINYTFTNKGDISEIKETDDRGNLLMREIFLYDDTGNNTQTNIYNPDGSDYAIIEYLYNAKNNLISYRNRENCDSLLVYYEADYVGDSLLVSDMTEVTVMGELTSVTKSKYDPLGNVLSREISFPKEKKTEQKLYMYKWDLWGNWKIGRAHV